MLRCDRFPGAATLPHLQHSELPSTLCKMHGFSQLWLLPTHHLWAPLKAFAIPLNPLQAAVLVWHQAGNLGDPVLNADPLHAVTPSHFLWASVLFGYLAYDTLYRCGGKGAVGGRLLLCMQCLCFMA